MRHDLRRGMLSCDWEFIGAALADEDVDAQIEFFRAFVKECKSWGTAQQAEKQLASVKLGLTDDERETLAMLGYKEQP